MKKKYCLKRQTKDTAKNNKTKQQQQQQQLKLHIP